MVKTSVCLLVTPLVTVSVGGSVVPKFLRQPWTLTARQIVAGRLPAGMKLPSNPIDGYGMADTGGEAVNFRLFSNGDEDLAVIRIQCPSGRRIMTGFA